MSDSSLKTTAPELDPEITLGVLNAVESNDSVTQRSLAQDLGIALGLANAYLKRCAKKGLIKITHAPANRYLYYLTPQGFVEKRRLTAEYLSVSFNFFRKARSQYAELFDLCSRRGWHRVVLYGKSDLAEIAILSAGETGVEIIGIIEPTSNQDTYLGVRVFSDMKAAGQADAAMITDLTNPQARFDELLGEFPSENILAPYFLHISRVKPSLAE
ncbi:MAG: winged helix-turn-helix transcriptional regulator [Rhodospirillales bacterium]